MTSWIRKQPRPRSGKKRAFGGSRPAAALAAVPAALAASACEGPARQEYRIGAATYSFPQSDVRSARSRPDLFIRINPSDAPYELVYDAASADLLDAHGSPVIFSVSDEDHAAVRRMRVGGLLLLCRAAPHPRSGCGTSVHVNGAVWSVLIPSARVGDAEQLVERARATLNSYRVR